MPDFQHWPDVVAFAHARIIEIEGACDHSIAPTECEVEAELAARTGLVRGARIDGKVRGG